ncbi:MAG: exodeoxyribonuclease VII small subunit [Gammaproteobacteria bacterium]
MATTRKTKNPDFEKLLGELDKIVQRMEQGDQSLDQTMKDFERGMELSEQCQKSLDAAQQRVDKLVKKHGNFQLESMDDELDDDEEEYDEESDYE